LIDLSCPVALCGIAIPKTSTHIDMIIAKHWRILSIDRQLG